MELLYSSITNACFFFFVSQASTSGANSTRKEPGKQKRRTEQQAEPSHPANLDAVVQPAREEVLEALEERGVAVPRSEVFQVPRSPQNPERVKSSTTPVHEHARRT